MRVIKANVQSNIEVADARFFKEAFAKMCHVMHLGFNFGKNDLAQVHTRATVVCGPNYKPPCHYCADGILLDDNFKQI